MAKLRQDFESTFNLGSDSDDSYVTEIADEDLGPLKSKIIRYLSETDKFSAYIVHKEGQPANLMITLGEKKAKSNCTTSMRSRPTKKLLVKNVPPTSNKDHLQMFFEYEKGQGGGPVKQVTINDDRSAIVEFEQARSVGVVLQKAPIQMLGETVDVKAYVPYLESGETIDSIITNSLPVELSKDIAAMTFKRELKVGDRVSVKRSVIKPRDGWGQGVIHKSVGTIIRFGTNTKGERAVFVNFPTYNGWSGDPDEMEIVY